MACSNADSHDLDKLEHWSLGLSSGTPKKFPIYAVFLVGPEDRYAHDVFREFRSSFGQLGAEFEHLVIFGQHGVSTTVRGLMSGLGLHEDSLPLLALFASPSAKAAHTIALAGGDPSENTAASEGPWREALNRLASAGKMVKALDAASIQGIKVRPLRDGPLDGLASRLLAG